MRREGIVMSEKWEGKGRDREIGVGGQISRIWVGVYMNDFPLVSTYVVYLRSGVFQLPG
jgi:hypothetical protein